MSAKPKYRWMSQYDSLRKKEGYDIIECALEGNFDGVDAALEIDPRDINAQRESNGITALMAASGSGRERMVEHLLKKDGIDLSLVDNFGRSAFDHARLFPPIVALLMRHAYPNMSWQEPGIFSIK